MDLRRTEAQLQKEDAKLEILNEPNAGRGFLRFTACVSGSSLLSAHTGAPRRGAR
jgi:hypothetical protein